MRFGRFTAVAIAALLAVALHGRADAAFLSEAADAYGVQSEAVVLAASGTVDLTYTSSWNMTSLPVTPVNATLSALFPDAVSAFDFSGAYAQQTTISTCKGYWFNLTTGGLYNVAGADVAQCNVTLPSSWSMIGAPKNGVAVSAIVQTPAANIVSIFAFAGGYNQVNLTTGSLAQGQGYWVNMANGGNLVMNSAAAAPAPSGKSIAGTLPQDMALANSSIVVSAGGLEQTLWLGAAAENMVQLPPPPPASITTLDVRANVGGVSTWMVPAAGSSVEYPVQLMGTDLDLKWNVDQADMNLWQLVIDGRAQDLSGQGSLNLSKAPVQMSLRYTPLPSQFALMANYPNPFNPSTTIRYAMGAEAQVKLAIYDVLGQKVRHLVNQSQAAGSYSVEWDGRSDAGQQVGNGIYFYEINAGDFHAVRKMLLTK